MANVYYVTQAGWKWHMVMRHAQETSVPRRRRALCGVAPWEGWEAGRNKEPKLPDLCLCKTCMKKLKEVADG